MQIYRQDAYRRHVAGLAAEAPAPVAPPRHTLQLWCALALLLFGLGLVATSEVGPADRAPGDSSAAPLFRLFLAPRAGSP